MEAVTSIAGQALLDTAKDFGELKPTAWLELPVELVALYVAAIEAELRGEDNAALLARATAYWDAEQH
jgi:hypothetical protein